MPDAPQRRFSWRAWIRSLHRDVGYVAVGLTVVYAVSGLAVNHISDWDPNFKAYQRVSHVAGPLPEDNAEAAARVLRELGIREAPSEVNRWAADQLELKAGNRRLSVNPITGRVVEEGRKPRLLLRLANWLHLNRGKKAWTLIADLYALGLLTLALTGLFMLPGKKGLRGRGGVLVLLGLAVPVLYVVLSGGPEAGSSRATPAAPVVPGPRP